MTATTLAPPASAAVRPLPPEVAAACAQTRRVLVERRWLVMGVLLLLVGAVVSGFVGVTDVSLSAVLADEGHARAMLWYSRLPRTAAILLAGSAAAVAGVVLQMLVRNRFVEPSAVGTTESAQLGLLAVTILAPGIPLPGRLAVASATAVGGTLLFLAVLRAVPLRSVVTVPLVGLMLGGVIGAVTAFFAFHFDLMQTLGAWITGDFSGSSPGASSCCGSSGRSPWASICSPTASPSSGSAATSPPRSASGTAGCWPWA